MCHRPAHPWAPRVPGGPAHPTPRPVQPDRPLKPDRPRLQPTFDGEDADRWQGDGDE